MLDSEQRTNRYLFHSVRKLSGSDSTPLADYKRRGAYTIGQPLLRYDAMAKVIDLPRAEYEFG